MKKAHKSKSLNTKPLHEPAKAVLRPSPAGTESTVVGKALAAPNTAKKLDRGPIWARDGSVLVDQTKYPTLWRAVQAAAGVMQAVRAKWSTVEEAARHGHWERAEALRKELLGVAPAGDRPIVVPADLPAGVPDLVEALKKAPDKKAAGKIRAKLRELGVKGGLRALRALPLVLLIGRWMIE